MSEPIAGSPASLWTDVVPELKARLNLPAVGNQQIRIWSLVLSSQYIIHRVAAQTGGRAILVPGGDAPEAVEQIAAFETENASWQMDWVPPADAADPIPSIIIVALLGIFHGLVTAGLFATRAVWISEGSAQAGLIMSGEIWRAVTALTLHADMPHVLSNMVIGGFFVVWLCRELGNGLGWAAVLVSGIAGNLVNAAVQSPLHNAVGASTAVFGAIGILSALRIQTQDGSSKGVVLPLMTGIILMALLGTGGERTDVGAHLFGLLAGLAIGAGLTILLRRGWFPAGRRQRQLATAAALVPAIAWAAAFA